MSLYGAKILPAVLCLCVKYCLHKKIKADDDDDDDACASSVNYGNIKILRMHRRLGSATLSQLVFPGEGNPNFQWKKSHGKIP